MNKKEILHIVNILGFMVKVNNEINLAEKSIFKIVCQRFKIKNSDLKSILMESFSLKESLGNIIIDEFIKIKETELRQYETHVHSWERERYM